MHVATTGILRHSIVNDTDGVPLIIGKCRCRRRSIDEQTIVRAHGAAARGASVDTQAHRPGTVSDASFAIEVVLDGLNFRHVQIIEFISISLVLEGNYSPNITINDSLERRLVEATGGVFFIGNKQKKTLSM